MDSHDAEKKLLGKESDQSSSIFNIRFNLVTNDAIKQKIAVCPSSSQHRIFHDTFYRVDNRYHHLITLHIKLSQHHYLSNHLRLDITLSVELNGRKSSLRTKERARKIHPG